MLKAYFDDAGTHGPSPIVVLGGLIGTIGQWEILEGEWRKRLADPLPEAFKKRLSMFHMAACDSGVKEFSDYKPVERVAVARNFRDIIARAKLSGTTSAVDPVAWNELVTGPARDLLGSPLDCCVVGCLDRVRDFAFDHPDGRQVAVMFDQGIETDRIHKIIDGFIDGSDGRVEFSSITFGKVKDYYPLQAADIVATCSYWNAQNYMNGIEDVRDRDLAFKKFYEDKPFEGLMLDRAGIVADMQLRGPDGKKRISEPNLIGLNSLRTK